MKTRNPTEGTSNGQGNQKARRDYDLESLVEAAKCLTPPPFEDDGPIGHEEL